MIDPEFGKRFTEIIEKSGISNAKLTELAEISKNNIRTTGIRQLLLCFPAMALF